MVIPRIRDRVVQRALVLLLDEQNQIILPIIEQLFRDAGVKWERTNS
jgi:hypothetical protein